MIEELSDVDKAARLLARAVVELETETQINWDLKVAGPGTVVPGYLREVYVRNLARLYEAVERSGLTVDRDLAVGRWAPRRS